jgi:hypothetical protein
MDIEIKRKYFSRWGVDGECHINGKKVCDTVEHPAKHRPCGEYKVTKTNFNRYFMQGNGPMKSIQGEISLGVYTLKGFVLNTKEMHQRVRQRVKKALKRGEKIELKILK